MKDHKNNKLLQRVLHARQLGLKLIANVTYGYSSANFSGRMPSVEVSKPLFQLLYRFNYFNSGIYWFIQAKRCQLIRVIYNLIIFMQECYLDILIVVDTVKLLSFPFFFIFCAILYFRQQIAQSVKAARLWNESQKWSTIILLGVPELFTEIPIPFLYCARVEPEKKHLKSGGKSQTPLREITHGQSN